MHSPDHSTKGTPSALARASREWPLTAGENRGSGSLSSPLRGAFHLSLTVLVHYRSLKLFSLGGWSPQLPTRLHVPRGTQDANRHQRRCLYRTLTVYGGVFQTPSSAPLVPLCWSYNPACSLPLREETGGLGSSRFARHYYGNLI